jgi:hypothetical protein
MPLVFFWVKVYLRLYWQHNTSLRGTFFAMSENIFIFDLAYFFLPDDEKALA